MSYFQCHLGGFALLEDDTVFRDAFMWKPPLPAREDAEGSPHGMGGPTVP